MSYALGVTLKAPAVPDLYDQVVPTYEARLEILQPVVAIPITVHPQHHGRRLGNDLRGRGSRPGRQHPAGPLCRHRRRPRT
ncbi:hypothetical protein ACIQB5_46465 [Streptomyces sp. NPDC088560]|uniref:hypothetical protein n=1 Tax=Streptomyces sp. NPDC088560 TaxID=3365868 RepID=UPI003817C7B4